MNIDELPKWEEIEPKPQEDLNPLEEFIYENEPAGYMLAKQFRLQLINLINYVQQNPVG